MLTAVAGPVLSALSVGAGLSVLSVAGLSVVDLSGVDLSGVDFSSLLLSVALSAGAVVSGAAVFGVAVSGVTAAEPLASAPFALSAPSAAAAGGAIDTSGDSGAPVSTLAIRNTNSDRPRNVSPPAERFGSSSGRRTIIGSMSMRTRNQAAPANSQI